MSLNTANQDVLCNAILFDRKEENIAYNDHKDIRIKELETKVKKLESKIQHLSWVARIQSLS